jgi:hypothetical protein
MVQPAANEGRQKLANVGAFGGSIADCDDLIKELNAKEHQNNMSRQAPPIAETKASTFTLRGGSPKSPSGENLELNNGVHDQS